MALKFHSRIPVLLTVGLEPFELVPDPISGNIGQNRTKFGQIFQDADILVDDIHTPISQGSDRDGTSQLLLIYTDDFGHSITN